MQIYNYTRKYAVPYNSKHSWTLSENRNTVCDMLMSHIIYWLLKYELNHHILLFVMLLQSAFTPLFQPYAGLLPTSLQPRKALRFTTWPCSECAISTLVARKSWLTCNPKKVVLRCQSISRLIPPTILKGWLPCLSFTHSLDCERTLQWNYSLLKYFGW